MKRLAAPILIIVALAALAIWGELQQSGQETATQPIVCPDPVAGCTFIHKGMPANLRFSSQPEALRPFVLSLTSPSLRKASVSFQMSGMNMGFNRYDLKLGDGGLWSANITLPVCTVNRVDWIAELDLDGQLYSLTFAAR